MNKKYAYEVSCEQVGGTKQFFDEEEGTCEDPSIVTCVIEDQPSDAYPALMVSNYKKLSK